MKTTRWIPERPEYYVQTGAMWENPHGVPVSEIVRMIAENPPEVTAQTVFGKYVEASGLVFTGELIQMMLDRSIPRVMGNAWGDPEAPGVAKLFREQNKGWWGTRYHIGVDLARQTDFTVISVLDTFTLPARLVYYRRLNRVPWEMIYTAIGRSRYLFGPNVLADSTGMGGDVVLDALHERLYCPQHDRTVLMRDGQCFQKGNALGCNPETYVALSCVDGFDFSGTTKKQLVDHLRNVLSVGYDKHTPEADFGWLRTPPIVQLEEELTFYTWDDKRLQTDCLFSLALAAWSGLEDVPRPAVVGSAYGD